MIILLGPSWCTCIGMTPGPQLSTKEPEMRLGDTTTEATECWPRTVLCPSRLTLEGFAAQDDWSDVEGGEDAPMTPTDMPGDIDMEYAPTSPGSSTGNGDVAMHVETARQRFKQSMRDAAKAHNPDDAKGNPLRNFENRNVFEYL